MLARNLFGYHIPILPVGFGGRNCRDGGVNVNVDKPKEMVTDSRRSKPERTPPGNQAVQRVWIKFLGVLIASDLSSFDNNSLLESKINFLRKFKQAQLTISSLTVFHRGTVESMLTYGISIWFSGCRETEKKALQMAFRSAERVIAASLPFVW